MTKKLNLLYNASLFPRDKRVQMELYWEFYYLVYDMVKYIIKEHASTEDIIQEAFIRSLNHAHKYQEQDKIEGWLKKIAKNTALNYFRKIKKTRNELIVGSVVIDHTCVLFTRSPSIEQVVEKKYKNKLVTLCINRLNPEYRKIVVMKYYHDMSYKEIAANLATTEGAVRQKLARAREKIKISFEKEWEV
ncbi:RNA polymerase sigma factor [Paenibacillus taiwanensis]|uniref:RNA polymerase sigma factor n=1 Tax=Paenibacillus taiwanensis TaxID=401638 RepID=UPI000491A1F6|nr:RNA polymerase sigma factor [Paenibacillus taiwanensis]